MDERTCIDQQAREFFEGLWQRGDHWELESSAFEQMKYARILALLDGRHYPRVLELGCSAGTLTRHLASLADYVLALDIASGAIDRAQALWTGPATVDFHQANIMEYNPLINADDFGASTGINRGIFESHIRGVVTSTSLMVTGRAACEAVAISRDCPELSLGLHWDISGEGAYPVGRMSSPAAIRDAFQRQLDAFSILTGRMPTHIDSHHHLHRRADILPVFRELVEPLEFPLRNENDVHFIGGFYAQWEWMVTNLEYVSIPTLQRILQEEVSEGWTEIACHPGYVTADFSSVYLQEGEEEVRTLTEPRIRQTIEALGIRLVNYTDYLA